MQKLNFSYRNCVFLLIISIFVILRIPSPPSSAQEIEEKPLPKIKLEFDLLVKTVSSYSQYIINIGKNGPIDTVIQLIDNNGSGGFNIDIRKKKSEFELRMDISRFSRTKMRRNIFETGR